jgi:HlyD family secretion protein
MRRGGGDPAFTFGDGIRWKRVRRLTACPTLALLLLAGCSKKEEEEAPAGTPSVQVAAAVQGPIRRIVEADAVLYPFDQAAVMPKISAPVQKFNVNRGDHVRSGELLATLENRDLMAAVAAAKAQLDQAEANYRAVSAASVPEEVVKAQTDVQGAQQAYDAAQRIYQSRQELLKEGALARRLVDEAQVAAVQAKGQLDAAREHLRTLQSVGKDEQVKTAAAQVEAARANYQAAQAQLNYSEIHSPISGVVAERPLYAGELASPSTTLLTVMEISRVVARVNVPQGQANAIRVGNTATLTQAGTDLQLPGKVTVVSPATDPASTTVQVWVQADNPGERWKPGAGVHAAIATQVIPNAVVIPASALLAGEEGGTVVLVVGSDSVAHIHPVDVGIREGDKVQILKGVSPGDQVVIQGGVGIDDNTKVQIAKPGENADADDDKGGNGGKDDEKGK